MNPLVPGFRICVDTDKPALNNRDRMLAFGGVTVPQARDLLALAIGVDVKRLNEQKPLKLRTGKRLERLGLVCRCQIAGEQSPAWMITRRGCDYAAQLARWIAEANPEVRRVMMDVTARRLAEVRA